MVEGSTYNVGAFCFHGKKAVSVNDYLRQEIIGEMHKSKFIVYEA